MHLVTEPVEVVARGFWADDKREHMASLTEDERQQEREKFGEYVRVKAPGDDDTRRYTLDRSVNGEVKVGQKLKLAINSTMKPKAVTARDGSAFVKYEEKWRVIGAQAA